MYIIWMFQHTISASCLRWGCCYFFCHGYCATSQGSLYRFEVDLSPRPACSLWVVCVLSIWIISWYEGAAPRVHAHIHSNMYVPIYVETDGHIRIYTRIYTCTRTYLDKGNTLVLVHFRELVLVCTYTCIQVYIHRVASSARIATRQSKPQIHIQKHFHIEIHSNIFVESYTHHTRDLHILHKRPTNNTKETYTYYKRDQHTTQDTVWPGFGAGLGHGVPRPGHAGSGNIAMIPLLSELTYTSECATMCQSVLCVKVVRHCVSEYATMCQGVLCVTVVRHYVPECATRCHGCAPLCVRVRHHVSKCTMCDSCAPPCVRVRY